MICALCIAHATAFKSKLAAGQIVMQSELPFIAVIESELIGKEARFYDGLKHGRELITPVPLRRRHDISFAPAGLHVLTHADSWCLNPNAASIAPAFIEL